MTYPQIRQDLFVHPSPSLSLPRIINGVTYGRTHRLIMDSNPRRREWQIGEILPPFPADKDAMHTPLLPPPLFEITGLRKKFNKCRIKPRRMGITASRPGPAPRLLFSPETAGSQPGVPFNYAMGLPLLPVSYYY